MALTKIIANTPQTPNNSDAQDWASMLNAIVGDVSGVLTYGNELEVEIVNDNKIKIKDGVYSLQGHMIRIHEGTDLELTVNSGTLGVKRIDLLVVTYEKNINNQEDDVFKFEVVQGDAIASNEGNPTPPNITQNNLLEGGIKRQEVLYELHLNETTLSLVDKRQFVTSIRDLENRVESGFKNIAKPTLLWQGVQSVGELNVPDLNNYSIIQIVTGDANDTSGARGTSLISLGNVGAVHYVTSSYGNQPSTFRITISYGKITIYDFQNPDMRILKIYGII